MCSKSCIERKREAGRKGGTTTYRKHGRAHMSRIGREGFLALALRLGGGEFHATADAVALLGQRGAFIPYR